MGGVRGGRGTTRGFAHQGAHVGLVRADGRGKQEQRSGDRREQSVWLVRGWSPLSGYPLAVERR